MGQKYEQFIDNGTKILLDLFVLPCIEEGERQAVCAAWGDFLSANVAKHTNMPDPAYIIGTASLSYIDKRLTGYMTAKSCSGKDYDAALLLCDRQRQFLKLFAQNGWKLPAVENKDPAVCEATLANWRDRDERIARILRLDADIGTAVSTAGKELTQASCDHLASLVEKLQFEIEVCHKKKDPLPHIQHHDLNVVRKHLDGLRKESCEKAQTHTMLIEIDRQLGTLKSSPTIEESQLCKAIILCQQSQLLLLNCQNNQWSLPSIRICTVAEIRSEYFLFVEKLLVETKITDIEEKKALHTVFSQQFEARILDFEDISDPALTLHTVSVIFVDNELSGLMSRRKFDRKDYDTALNLCIRLNAILHTFRQNNWVPPKINNPDPAACEARIHQMQDTDERLLRISQLDAAIDNSLSIAAQELTQTACDNVLVLVDDMQRELDACKKKSISVPTTLKNVDIEALHQCLSALRKNAEKKTLLYLGIKENDAKLLALVHSNPTMEKQWNEILALCQQLTQALSDCKKSMWQIPRVTSGNLDNIQRRYRHYLEMQAVDQKITDYAGYLESAKLFKPYLEQCGKQVKNIDYCVRSKWPLPLLQNASPSTLITNAKRAMENKNQFKKIKIGFIGAGVTVLAVIILICCAVAKSREGKIEIPFSASYAVSKDYLEIKEELEDAGFTDISLVESEDGWLETGKVLSVAIDNSDIYTKGKYKDPDVTIVITYSSENRIDVSDLLADWQILQYTDIEERLRVAGFTNITTNAETTHDAKQRNMVNEIRLNNNVYTNGHAYLPANAPIDITYWDLKILISDNNTAFLGRNYENVVDSLKEDGFTNVQVEAIKTGWASGNSVISVAINNQTDYAEGDEFSPDAKIVVKYSSDDRSNASSILSDWPGKDHTSLESALRSAGFTNLSFKTTPTATRDQNHKVAGVKINGESFTGGECYIQKAAPIEITVYVLQINIGRSSGDIESDYYTDIVTWLRDLGFTNITLKRTNDLVTGWINKEGTIKSISVNDNDDFDENAVFDYDTEIIIIVYTFKNKGCEDITIVA